ncbi:MAG: nitroreductase family protein, partial [Halieaceae bacterium]
MTDNPSSIIQLLTERVSHASLGLPGPSRNELDTIIRAGMRAPDHAMQRPWHFVIVQGERRDALGLVLNESLKLRGVTDEAQLNKALKAPLRAPVVIAVLLKFKDHPKVERNEQIGSAAAATYAMSLAANALGFGSIWRTGLYATDPHVISALGGGDKDEVIGFLYLGT